MKTRILFATLLLFATPASAHVFDCQPALLKEALQKLQEAKAHVVRLRDTESSPPPSITDILEAVGEEQDAAENVSEAQESLDYCMFIETLRATQPKP